eukprot:CAMPEP_0201576884 /NCGR_PEP_ID=MMETSP0190_2-20130828/22946_1 /ASSEMBLY_ACC=CAM_ASM_000263 /TAXON_ID=37353 /ORGANISM="Rosalina sp." /LENGTH=419 /DNA_ID=CAMNT_0048008263 /DNA_START=78 /DNA_END=1337 /DNA_ORIENTATION=-
MGKSKEHYRSQQIHIQGQLCCLETWHTSRNMFHNNRHSKITHHATGMIWTGFSKDTYKESETQAINAATNWIIGWLQQQKAKEDEIARKAAEAERARQEQIRQEQERIHQQQLAEQERIRQQQLKAQKRASLTLQKDELQSQVQNIITQELNPINLQKTQIERQILTEEKSIEGMKLERNDKSKKIIVCVGKTGHGKSTVVNRLAGDISLMAKNGPCKTSISGKSCTQSLQKIRCGNLCVIDCPGWADSGGADREHSNNLCAFLKGCGGINAIVLIRNATQYRFDADFQQKLKHLADIFGDKFWNNLVIVLTHVDKGMAEAMFVEGKKAEEMQKEIAQLCGKNITVPVIPFGLDNYKDKMSEFKSKIPKNRYICDKIKSPIDMLREEKKQVIIRQKKIKTRIDGMNGKITAIQNEINSL